MSFLVDLLQMIGWSPEIDRWWRLLVGLAVLVLLCSLVAEITPAGSTRSSICLSILVVGGVATFRWQLRSARQKDEKYPEPPE
jgi:hypothetical protein